MKILMLSWEFPPQVIGGLGRHVDELSQRLSGQGVEPFILTPQVEGCPVIENKNGTSIYRIGAPMPAVKGFRTWIFGFNSELVSESIRLHHVVGGFDLVHAHDWLVGYAGRSISQVLDIPLITTIHATESGRNVGLHSPIQNEIHEIEQNLIRESDRVICCSHYMHDEILNLFQPQSSRIVVIPNGVNENPFIDGELCPGELKGLGIEPRDKVIFHIGRLVPEKGAEVLLNAFARVVRQQPHSKLVIGGKGSLASRLEEMTEKFCLGDRVIFTGYISDETRDLLYSRADVAVFPSLYEPFGIVALEAMAARTPVVVSDVGGLSEIVENGVTGLKVPPSDDEALAHAILKIVSDPRLANHISDRARQVVREKYSWELIAAMTSKVYKEFRRNTRRDEVLI